MTPKLIKPKHYYNEFKQLLNFALAPIYSGNKTFSLANKVEGAWTMFVVKTILAVIVGVSIGLFYDPDNRTTTSLAERFSPAVLLFVSVFALPFLEEVAYRLSLKFKPIFLALTLGVIVYYISSKIIFQTKLSDVHFHFMERVILVLITIGITYPLILLPKIRKSLAMFWQENFKRVFYFFSFTFAWIHIFNYELNLEHILLMPIITLPKLVSALCYGYVRINYGFIYCFAIHMLNNGIAFIVRMLTDYA